MRLWSLNFAVFGSLFLLSPAWAELPQTVGLGGGGRSGLGKEAIESNPAGVALLRENTMVVGYSLSRVQGAGGRGRVQTAAVYDGTSDFGRGGVGYIRESRVRVAEGRTYNEDTTNFRGVFARPLYGQLIIGSKISYVTRTVNGKDDKYFSGDMGFIYPVFRDMVVGLTGENLSDRSGERPRAIAAGARYDFVGPLQIYGDLERTIGQQRNAALSWSLGAELKAIDEIVVRGALFRDSVEYVRGWSVGISWVSPRTTLEYALRQSTSLPKEIDHVFGMGVTF